MGLEQVKLPCEVQGDIKACPYIARMSNPTLRTYACFRQHLLNTVLIVANKYMPLSMLQVRSCNSSQSLIVNLIPTYQTTHL